MSPACKHILVHVQNTNKTGTHSLKTLHHSIAPPVVTAYLLNNTRTLEEEKTHSFLYRQYIEVINYKTQMFSI